MQPSPPSPWQWQLERPLQTPRLSVCAQTLGAAVAPPAGGAGVVRREPADAAEVACR